jgi:maltose alpha-D-glucosyltransferase/alpha-amylase
MDSLMSPQTASPTIAVPADDPLWYKDAVIYQLHLKSFFDADQDGIGDFQGLIDKLDYIAELGVTAIWMLPFYPSPRRDDGYDISDYRGVHPDYGTLADVRRFIEAAHARNIRVIAELVVNHTSDQHPWFQRARAAPPGSPEREFYVWSDDDKKYAGTRVIFLDTEKSNWTWDDEARAYFWHRFYSHQPDLNFDNPAVLEEVLSVMRFWLDMGIDGLRLDAVPYLVEREGTNNENLVETHDILKRIRAELDRHAPGRMLLAEANQWPEDAQQYFGDGDECHMSFHFPLMPRMYMAIAREDRFPITDIMRQTPAIPANCQWAIFLRNHDELTLEMVTSSERDYLWETYASDRRARINLGIRRRLAPLLERDRRRIELMNSLLLSMPGTPVIYYGDEIGMGDNIHLGDRDGVRTPMQWSVDRNGGFSRADPAALVLPPIMDPIYGFQAVNVESQARDQHSLLNWTRTMLAVRRRHQAFGRGTQRFLYPQNRKILAYTREYADDSGEEVILCVSNLSRTAQAVELDLSTYMGRTPVDLVGGAAFPVIGQLSYLLTLPPYAFYWFALQTEAASGSAPAPMPEFATIVLRRDIVEVLQPTGRAILEREALPLYLQKRRWFGSKGEKLNAVRLAYAVKLGEGIRSSLITEIEADVGGRTENYTLPLGVCRDDSSSGPLAQQLALTRVRRTADVGYLTDAFALDAFSRNIIDAWRQERTLPFEGGRIEFRKTPLLDDLVLPDEPEIHRLSAEQSNSSLIVDEQLVLKIVRKVLAGRHPEAEMTGYLTERGFRNIAPLYGEVIRYDETDTPHTIMLAQGFVRNQGDAWSWTLDYAKRVSADIAAGDDPGVVEDALSGYIALARAIGQRLAEMHTILASDSEMPEFQPEDVDTAIAGLWADGVIEQIDGAVNAISRIQDFPNEEARNLAQVFMTQADALRRVARELAGSASGRALQTRVHGDFHLGQVLVTPGDATLIDFEGEPAKTMEQRRAKSSPLRDVAGMLRSFDYAAASAAAARPPGSEQAAERQNALVEKFRRASGLAFLDSYRSVLRAAPRRWVEQGAEADLLNLFLLEKAAYEIRYEAANRPAWIAIPLAGIARVARQIIHSQEDHVR